jgi:hypothetical protein
MSFAQLTLPYASPGLTTPRVVHTLGITGAKKGQLLEALQAEFQFKLPPMTLLYVLENMLGYDILPQHCMHGTFDELMLVAETSQNTTAGRCSLFPGFFSLTEVGAECAMKNRNKVGAKMFVLRLRAITALSRILNRDVAGLIKGYLPSTDDAQSADDIYRDFTEVPEGSMALEIKEMKGTGILKAFGVARLELETGRIRIDDAANPPFWFECQLPGHRELCLSGPSKRKRLSTEEKQEWVSIKCKGRHVGRELHRMKCNFFPREGRFHCFDNGFPEFQLVFMVPPHMVPLPLNLLAELACEELPHKTNQSEMEE